MSQLYWHFTVTGRVQGVSFRAYTQQEGLRLGLKGYVRNLKSGDVEIVANGSLEQLEALRAWCHQGSPHASVDRVVVNPLEPVQLREQFEIRYTDGS